MKLLSTFFAAALLMIGCAQNTSNGQALLSPKDFSDKIKSSGAVQVIDVRTPEEFNGGFIANAVNINIYDNDFAQRLAQLDKAKPVFVYCKAGGRSKEAARQLSNLGFKQVYDLQGGMMSWEHAGMPVEKPKGAVENDKGMTVPQFNELINAHEVVLIDFYAPWCGPCKQMAPAIASLQKKYEGSKVNIVKIDVDQNKELVSYFGLDQIPVTKVFKNGQQVETRLGFVSEEQLNEMIEKNL